MEEPIKIVSASEGKVAVYDYGMALVGQIERAHDAMWETTDSADVDEEQLKGRANGIYSEVCQEEKDGKPVFTNDGARKAEASKREQTDLVMKELKARARTKARNASNAKARVEALNNRLKIVVAFLRGEE